MASKNRGIHTYTVQEGVNVALPRLINITPTIVADDNADNDVAFNWTEIPNASLTNGRATKLVSVGILDPNVSLASLDLFFCRGAGSAGTAPTAAQNLQDGAAGSAVVDITAAEALEIVICGNVSMPVDEGGLILASTITKGNINLIMAPAANSTSLYVGGVWRSNPADISGGVAYMEMYLGFEG